MSLESTEITKAFLIALLQLFWGLPVNGKYLAITTDLLNIAFYNLNQLFNQFMEQAQLRITDFLPRVYN